MIGSHAIVGWNDEKSNSKVQEYQINAKDPSQIVPANNLFISNTEISEISGISTLRFRAKCDGVYLLSGNTSMVIAAYGFNSYQLSYHTMRTLQISNIDFGTGKVVIPFVFTIMHWHGLLMFVAFGILFPSGLLVARYAKTTLGPIWFNTHVAIQVIGGIMAATGFGLSIYNLGGLSLNLSETHHVIGFVLILLVAVQVIGGAVRPHIEPGVPKTYKRVVFEVVHHWSGRTICALAVPNIFFGLDIIGATAAFPIVYLALLILVGFSLIFFEIRRRRIKAGAKEAQNDTLISPLLNNEANAFSRRI